jgi:lipopolysaccharide export system permease protein
MIIKTYQKYILSSFLNIFLKISLIFFCLVFILSIFEEINFFKDLEVGFFLPLFLTLLNTPSVLHYIFPFIFLISTQFFFIRLFDNDELNILKKTGLSNFKILKIIVSFTLILGILIVIFFYNFSAKIKFLYLDLKNQYSLDNKYLAVINENGLWIKDEINDKVLIVNADKIEDNFIVKVNITQLSKEFKLIQNIYSDKINVQKNRWFIKNAKLTKNNFNTINVEDMFIETNFNIEKINSIFSNLASLTVFELINLKDDYNLLGYSTLELDVHLQKIYAYPIYLMIMTLLSGIIMINIKHNKPKIFNLILGIFLSVIIYYTNYFFNVLGQSGKLPILLSIWIPIIILMIICIIGLVRINEK